MTQKAPKLTTHEAFSDQQWDLFWNMCIKHWCSRRRNSKQTFITTFSQCCPSSRKRSRDPD